jgi:hypothetical protein
MWRPLFLVFFLLFSCTPSPVRVNVVQENTYNITYTSHVRPEGQKWKYILLPPLQNVSVNYFSIDYFSIQASDLHTRPLHVYLNFGLRSIWNATRSQIDCDGVSVCETRTSLRHGDYTLHFHNPHEMSTSYIRYSVATYNKELTTLAQAIVLFFLAGVMLPILTVFLLMLLCYVKARQYLVELWH